MTKIYLPQRYIRNLFILILQPLSTSKKIISIQSYKIVTELVVVEVTTKLQCYNQIVIK